MPNRLANETSPYLLQHKDNPVDWYPWGDEALERARRENKPVMLSIGYSACHWCHVMEHESFEDPEIARVMNENFVNIKVDREERPDLDSIYMQVTTAMTGHGGWPMTVFLTPEGLPFYAGTYFPPTDRMGMPGFPRILDHVAQAYRERPQDVAKATESIREFLEGNTGLGARPGQLRPEVFEEAFRGLDAQFDEQNGGFGGAPKFPPSMVLELLLRHHKRTGNPRALDIAEHTLVKMARGGMYDQIGGGFHRYSVDAHWLVPHFEKMLYDNALLTRCYLMAYQVTGERFYARVAEDVLDYVLREMTSPEGGFYSTQDADSEGVEGKFYVWSKEEIDRAFDEQDARIAARYFDVSQHGNWEHTNVLNLREEPAAIARDLGLTPEELRLRVADIRARMFELREQRVRPGRDEKILTSWNGLMLRAMAEAASVLGDERFRRAAVANAEFVLGRLRVDDRLRHSYKDGRARFNGYLEDYAYYADGLISLYETTFDRRWLEEARHLTDQMVELFADEQGGGFFDTSVDHEQLITRPKDLYDNATPSANSVAAEVLLRLATLFADESYERRAVDSLERIAAVVGRAPSAFGRWLSALDFALSQRIEVALVGDPATDETGRLLETVWRRYLPNKVVAGRAPEDDASAAFIPLLAARGQIEGRPTAYVCRNYACQTPTTEPAELAKQLEAA